MKILLSGYLVFVSLFAIAPEIRAQDQLPAKTVRAVLFYTVDWELTTPEKAFYHREASFDIDNMQFDGVYKDYDGKNRMVAEGFYSKGEKKGLQTEYNNERVLKSTIEYLGKDFIIWELKDDGGESIVKSGTGKFTHYFFYIAGLTSAPSLKQGIVTGEFNRGRKVGNWIYSDLNQAKTDEEIYYNGKLVKRMHFADGQMQELDYGKEVILSIGALFTDAYAIDRNSFHTLAEALEKMIPYPAGFNRSIMFPGGIKKLILLLAKTSEIPEGYVVSVRVKMDNKGKITKYKVDFADGPNMKEQALNAVKRYEPLLLPAIKNGVPVASTIYFPLSGGTSWTDMVAQSPASDLSSKGGQQESTVSKILGVLLVVVLLAATLF